MDDDEARSFDLTVATGGQFYAIPVSQVRGVVRGIRLTRVPGAADVTLGIVNVRGAVVTVLDLAAMLTGVRAVDAPSVVLLEHGTRLIGLAVQTVHDVRIASVAEDEAAVADRPNLVPLDAAALCARHLLSSEEMQQ